MHLNNDQLKQKAHQSALIHDPYIARKSAAFYWRQIETEMNHLRQFVMGIYDQKSTCHQPAEEWLLSHSEFIEEQMLDLRQELRQKWLKKMPLLRKTNEIRMMTICQDYVEQAEGCLQEASFISYIQHYQEVSVLSIAEIWSSSLMLRLAFIKKIADMMEMIRERRDICQQVEALLSGIDMDRISPEGLKDALLEAGHALPLSGPLIVHLIKHLRERQDDTAVVAEWLMCKLEHNAEELDQILTYEFQLQAAYQLKMGNLIQSLRELSRMNWSEITLEISTVEQTLRQEPTGDYERLDMSSRNTIRKRIQMLARRLKLPENLIAAQAVECSRRELERKSAESASASLPADQAAYSRESLIYYYLFDPVGMNALRSALKQCGEPKTMLEHPLLRRAKGVYFSLLIIWFIVALGVHAAWFAGSGSYTVLEWLAIAILLVFPASEWAITAIHWLIERLQPCYPLLRYDYSEGVPPEASTFVVIPAIWSTVEAAMESVERLEIHYLANRDPHIYFALLGDFADAKQEYIEADSTMVEQISQKIEDLNRRYPGRPFHYYHRRRIWNPSEGKWMGWERKRGKLMEFVELLQGSSATSFHWLIGDQAVWPKIRYMITLDSDTILPLECAHRMIATMDMAYNKPRLNEAQTRVIEGYGVLQPRISMTHASVQQSRMAALWASEPGMDPYTFAVADPYQDGLGEGIFTGKGIFDVVVFRQLLAERIPDNRVLSHDLLEGGFLRAGFLADIELIDDFPARFSAHQMRQHRWVRGDWQLLIWLRSKVRNRRGELLPVDLSLLTRWQIADNMRRSLLFPALLGLLLLAFACWPAAVSYALGIVLITLAVPFIRQLFIIDLLNHRLRSVLTVAGQTAIHFITLPFQSAMLVDAMVRTWYRLFFSKRKLLEWVTAAESEQKSKDKGSPPLLGMTAGYIIIGFIVVSAWLSGQLTAQVTGGIMGLLWAMAPLIVRSLDRPLPDDKATFTEQETTMLKGLAQQIWSFYADYVNEAENFLPPDNVQFDPPRGIAHRTSPTNIGLYLASVLAALDFAFIDRDEVLQRLEATLNTMDRMERWHGHLYNWYDTLSLAPLIPRYVSTVDSGNLVACLIVVKEGLTEWIEKGLLDEQSLHRCESLIERLYSWMKETDFKPLYVHKAQLFSLGYHAEQNKLDEVLYDLMASEARQASFIAIAQGQVPVSHWYALGRTMTKLNEGAALLSWSGTMFEYLMPWSFMRNYRKTMWDHTYKAVVQRQIDYAAKRGVPFGISESGYYAFDAQMNYQYRAFGVPGLGFKRGLEQDLVISPYATILALPFAKQETIATLNRLESLDGKGKYGFYEALDFTKKRLPENREYKIIRSFMSHHQGMSLLTLANALLPEPIIARFHHNKEVKAAELLLQERQPRKSSLIAYPALQAQHLSEFKLQEGTEQARVYSGADTPTPKVCLLSNGKFSVLVTNSGSGYAKFEGLFVSRWREDAVRDPWGSYVYIRNVSNDQVWSPSFQPCRTLPEKQSVHFYLDKAVFTREEQGIKTEMEICVPAEWNAEVRRISLTNRSNEDVVLEVTSFIELALSEAQADAAHPAFSKLFIRTAYDAEAHCLVASRRKRQQQDRQLWSAHALMLAGQEDDDGAMEYETNRAAFIGRGHLLSSPQAIHSRLRSTVGSVADPAFVMRRRMTIRANETQQLIYVTSVGESREEAVDIIRLLSAERVHEQAFQSAWHHGQIERRNLHISHEEAASFQELAGQIEYTPPLRTIRRQMMRSNTMGLTGLWAFGISGDRPLVMVSIRDRSQLRFVMRLLVAHEYLRRHGLAFDMVILNRSAEGYQQQLKEELERLARQGIDRFGAALTGLFVLDEQQLEEEELVLLNTTARLFFQADGPSLTAQLRIQDRQAARQHTASPSNQWLPSSSALNTHHKVEKSLDATDAGLFPNGYGEFSPDGEQYRIWIQDGKALPAPWINVLANPQFGCLISEMGTGYTWWRNSRECKLTPWSNDPVLDPPGECVYLRDEESSELWTPAPIAGHSAQHYQVTHSKGYSQFESDWSGLKQQLLVFVPLQDPVKIVRLKLRNLSDKQRRLSLTYYLEWVLGVQREQNSSFIVTEWDDEHSMMVARNQIQEVFRDAHAFVGLFAGDPVNNDAMTDDHALSWTSDRAEFIGRNGSYDQPLGLRQQHLSGHVGVQADACGAVQARLVIEPGEEKTLYVVLGCDHSVEAVQRIARKYAERSACEQAFTEVTDFWEYKLRQITVQTPSKEMNTLLNGWLLYQSLACRMWARSAFYQAGGAYGYRDQLQDSLALLHALPDLTRRQIILHAAHQYEEGDVQHWWHEETNRGIRTKFTDDLLWLPYVVSRYIEHTGDDRILQETAPYLYSEPLQEEEHERYEETVRSAQEGTILEHCMRAIDLALRRKGEHGLPLIGVGDWNDGMNLVGSEGRGESVWLGWFICEVLQRFASLFETVVKDSGKATELLSERERLMQQINEHGWDGKWYRRAFTDAGAWLGSVTNDECRIDAIAQSWSVISGAAPRERMEQAMQSFDRELVDRELKLARLLTPPFDRTTPSPGYIQGYPPGIRENGAQYTHGVLWSIVAWSKLGRGDKAFELFDLLNPIQHTRTDQEVRQYVGEPYVMAADVYTASPLEGHAGWTWYTGASSWMYQAGIESILGVQRRGEKLHIRPSIPAEWPEYSVNYRFGQTKYKITILNPDGKSTADFSITLVDDGQEHSVTFTM